MLSSRLPLSVALAVLLHASAAHAFTEPLTYSESSASGGGGGRFFTGSPAEGYGCSVCHTGPSRKWPLAIEGLPEGGYEPGETYELVLRFEQFAEHARERREEIEDEKSKEAPPAVGLVAELVAETGIGSGKLEISPATEAEEAELCLLPPGHRATELYSVRPGEQTREGIACEATRLGQRCVVATRSCGASEMRVRWTAPERAQGPIWLSGGFVTTEHATGFAEDDAVQEFDHVLLPRGASQDHATATLQSGCTAHPSPGSPTLVEIFAPGSPTLVEIFVIVLTGLTLRLRRRRRTDSTFSLFALLLAALALGACADPETFDENEYAAHPQAGLFTPGSYIGADWEAIDAGEGDAGDAGEDNSAVEDAINEVAGEDRCIEREGEPGAAGELKIEFKTRSYGGFYEPANCGAVWIEDTEGQYVATPMIWAGLRTRNLFIWDARRCRADLPDAITSATLEEHGELHEAVWDGKDQTGKIVPDGSYVLNIEVTEDEFDYGERVEIPIERGAEPFNLEPEDTTSVTGLKLSFTPGK